jgi:hypothetical protein
MPSQADNHQGQRGINPQSQAEDKTAPVPTSTHNQPLTRSAVQTRHLFAYAATIFAFGATSPNASSGAIGRPK